MELIAYVVVVILVSVGSFWIAGSIYGLIHRPAIYFPISLATKMALCAVFGALFLMIGGVLLATMVFNAAMQQRPDYSRWPTIVSGLVISILCTIVIYFSAVTLAWKIIG
ncbi:hypothetical protein [Pseudohalioglobus lutimaris]|uniref:Uncharacterized protein n=1 Tax=Pseudohalioglobus lutimaris TaxID=1737061 RepID=A0A2N5WXX6_9GAMM|nr:hypothetical protein [Pseudohalioglobus lutimaris]PLW67084.1 hypothetical protein C0039_18885 [Pseudohalioglobus lutimaris]